MTQDRSRVSCREAERREINALAARTDREQPEVVSALVEAADSDDVLDLLSSETEHSADGSD